MSGKNQKGPVDPLTKSLDALDKQNSSSIYIRRLRFPNYRNLEADARLSFEFPITVLLGKNGTNKSSVIHALDGSVRNRTIADYWFETKLDAIPETRDGIKQSVTHTYLDKGKEVECIKARAPRSAADPDYWEPVKPTAVYGFAAGAPRESPILLNVLHLDCRAELPAFDKYFNFPDPGHLSTRAVHAKKKNVLRREYRKQDYLRQRSGHLRKLLDDTGTALTESELQLISYVLERDYVGGQILEHNIFHGHTGRTIRFKTKEMTGGYSDAFAGSGESGAVFLIHDVANAPDGSLILLDEPETSLHPRAQQRMLEFLCHYAVRKKFQIVMATHSYYFAEHLPSRAIRVLEKNPQGRIQISVSFSAREALHEIATEPAGKTIAVEDVRARQLVLAALEKSGPKAKDEIYVQVRDGGTSRIFQDIQAHAASQRKDLFLILDGDHRPTTPIMSKGSLPQGLSELKKLISEQTKGPNSSGPKLDIDSAPEATQYLEFLRAHVRFLPGVTPEELVWDRDEVKALGLAEVPDEVASVKDPKARLKAAAALMPGMDDDALFKILVVKFLAKGSAQSRELLALVDEIRACN